MENMKANIVVEEVGVSDVIDLKEVSKSFSFPAFPLTKPEFMSNFKRYQKAYTYIREYICVFGCDPTGNEVT